MNILIAIDGSPCSSKAVAELVRLSWPPQTKVRVITVEIPIDTGLVPGPMPAFDELVRQQKSVSQKRLDDAAAILSTSESNLTISTEILEGRPKDVIIAEADRFGADLVVVGSHGYGPIRRYFLGSISQYVANNAPCSVLIVR